MHLSTNTLLISLSDMCKLCMRFALVLPSCECFNKRLDDPNSYFVFHKYFVRAVIGDEEWKKSYRSGRESHTGGDSTITTQYRDQLCSPLDEAFALIMLQNNYFSWLLEAKEEMGEHLVTDYDSCHKLQDGTQMTTFAHYNHMKVSQVVKGHEASDPSSHLF
jgi:hypothetical protein